jgi:hypothetical protein
MLSRFFSVLLGGALASSTAFGQGYPGGPPIQDPVWAPFQLEQMADGTLDYAGSGTLPNLSTTGSLATPPATAPINSHALWALCGNLSVNNATGSANYRYFMQIPPNAGRLSTGNPKAVIRLTASLSTTNPGAVNTVNLSASSETPNGTPATTQPKWTIRGVTGAKYIVLLTKTHARKNGCNNANNTDPHHTLVTSTGGVNPVGPKTTEAPLTAPTHSGVSIQAPGTSPLSSASAWSSGFVMQNSTLVPTVAPKSVPAPPTANNYEYISFMFAKNGDQTIGVIGSSCYTGTSVQALTSEWQAYSEYRVLCFKDKTPSSPASSLVTFPLVGGYNSSPTNCQKPLPSCWPQMTNCPGCVGQNWSY